VIDLNVLRLRIEEKAREVKKAKDGNSFASNEYYSRVVRELYELREQLEVLLLLERIKSEFYKTNVVP
jgi:hypothetical protein